MQPGFFSSLFDFSFKRFAGARSIKVFYVLVVIALGLGTLAYLITGIAFLAGDEPALGVLIIIFTPLVALLYLMFARLGLELAIAIFRIMDHNRELISLTRQQMGLPDSQAMEALPGGASPFAPPQPGTGQPPASPPPPPAQPPR
jgi:uncharacterized protein DUF4282